VAAPLAAVHHLGLRAPAGRDGGGVLRLEVRVPVSDRDAADRLVRDGDPELRFEAGPVVGLMPKKQAPSSSSTAVSSMHSVAIPVSTCQYGTGHCLTFAAALSGRA